MKFYFEKFDNLFLAVEIISFGMPNSIAFLKSFSESLIFPDSRLAIPRFAIASLFLGLSEIALLKF